METLHEFVFFQADFLLPGSGSALQRMRIHITETGYDIFYFSTLLYSKHKKGIADFKKCSFLVTFICWNLFAKHLVMFTVYDTETDACKLLDLL